jgi:hypothetical protein
MLPNTDTAQRSRPTARTHRDMPVWERPLRSTMTGTRARACLTPPGARRQELPAVSHTDQSRIIASILSRRPEGDVVTLSMRHGDAPDRPQSPDRPQ